VIRMWAGRLDSRGCFSGRGKRPSLFQSVETSFGAHSSSYSVLIVGCLHGCKAVREWDGPQSLTRKAACVYRNNEAHLQNHCWRGEAIIIECYDCVCLIYSACKAHAPHYIVICSCLAVPFLTHYLINGTIFRKKLLKFKMCVLLLLDTFFLLRRIERDIINVHRSSYKVPFILVIV